MTEDQKKTYLAWLNDAHAMELGLVSVLEKQVEDTEGVPEMQSRIRQHLEETKQHAEKIATCIERHGSTPSTAKDFMSKMSATINGLGMSMMDDKMVKNVHSSYAAEHFEIATYTVIQAAAEELDDDETASICSDIIEDEIAMANWFIEQLPVVVEEQMQKDATE